MNFTGDVNLVTLRSKLPRTKLSSHIGLSGLVWLLHSTISPNVFSGFAKGLFYAYLISHFAAPYLKKGDNTAAINPENIITIKIICNG